MRAHRLAVAAAGGALGLMAAAPLAAWADSAPIGSASGSDLTVGSSASPIASVSSTGAQAGPTSAGSTADVLSVGGNPVIGGTSSNGDDQSGGTTLTPSSSPAQADLTPYSATSTPGDGQSEGRAAVARASTSPVDANVLQSQSDASYTSGSGGSTQSTGSGSTDGATVAGSGLDVDLLHSQASSTGQGSTYLLGLNGTDVGTSQQLAPICSAVNIPSTLALTCDAADGGAGNLVEQVLGGTVGSSGAGAELGGFKTAGTGSSGPAATTVPGASTGPGRTAPSHTPGLSSAPAGPGTATHGPASNGLPFTGAPIALLVFGSAALLGLGTITVKASTMLAPQLFG